MPVLTNPKHERFAQEVAKGTPMERAYTLAGYQQSAKNAARLRKNEGVSSRIEEILSRAAEKHGVTVEKIVGELAKIGFADIRNAVSWGDGVAVKGEDGLPVVLNSVAMISSDDIDDDTAAAIAEVSQTREGVKIKFHDKRAALVDLGKHLGMFKEKVELTGRDGGPIESKDVTARERLASRIAGIAQRSKKNG